MRYCDGCKAIRAIAQCPTCAGPTRTWAERLTDHDKTFLRSIRVQVDDPADDTRPS